MNREDKKEVQQIVNEGIAKVILPILDDILKNMATKEDIKEIRKEMATKKDIEDVREDISTLQTNFESMDRKLDAEIEWRDDASKRLKKVETKLELVK